MITGISFAHEYTDYAGGVSDAHGETYTVGLTPGAQTFLRGGVELSSLTDSPEARRLAELGWRGVNFALNVTSYTPENVASYVVDYLISQRERIADNPELEAVNCTYEELEAEARAAIASDVGVAATLVIAQPLQLPTGVHAALAQRLAAERQEEGQHRGHALHQYGGDILFAAVSDPRIGSPRSLHTESYWHRVEGRSVLEEPSRIDTRWWRVTGSDFLDEPTWQLIKGLRDQIYSAAITELGNQVPAPQVEAAPSA